MILLLLVAVSLAATLLARLAPRWDGALAWLVGAVLAACAGLFTQGFDHEEYVATIETTRQLSDEPLALQLFSAKDPVFLFIIDLAGLVTDNVQLVFAIVAALAVSTKVLATAALPKKRTAFMALYAVFVAPGLEFAAIRAGLAIGLIMLGYLAVRRVRWRALWISLGLASHMSVLFVVAGRIWPRWWRAILIGLVVLVPIALPALLSFVEEDARYIQYLDNRGTPLAFIMPGATLLSLLLLSRSLRGRLPAHHAVLSKDSLTASYFVVAMSLILTLPVVTAATRVMELAWVFMLLQFLARDRMMHRRVLAFQAASWCMMIGVLSLSNILRGLWAVLL
ncbi:EpsG family protein [Scleromatobacter humisilvae]|uniref:EpsG family protein n=1 Tax=Scleromatobacter humisilvae TaxID=2897159 RepID=A0A9X2C104_9BURK|nr:EpsG family protein [Scleromatobacter humisilvae]MCK9688353.1 EpsG family protein [Scleromatobacter humisilvae]